MAGAILWGLLKGARSSRAVEESTKRRIDVLWFLEGRTLDNTTVCNFRLRFGAELAGLMEALGQAAAGAAPQGGRTVAVDGTRIRANSARTGARTAERLRARLAALAEKREALLAAMARRDAAEDLEEALETPDEALDEAGAQALRRQIATLDAPRAKVARALTVAQERDAAKQAKDGPRATAVRVPVTDPEAYVLPHKEGGFGTNWTVSLATDAASHAVLEARGVEGAEEVAALAPAIEAVRRLDGRAPAALLVDGNYPTGPALRMAEGEGVALVAPSAPPVHPAVARADLSQPVEAERQKDLPMEGRGEKARLSRQAFVYDASNDCYYCPHGRVLRRVAHETRRDKRGQTAERWRYQSSSCAGCPLASRCWQGQAKGRTIIRDEYQPERDRLARRMDDPAAHELYRQRAPAVEGVFGYVKSVLGVRQFFYRGVEKVTQEWRWICAAYNLRLLLRRGRKPAAAGASRGANRSGGSLPRRRSLAAALEFAAFALRRALAPVATSRVA